MRRPRSGIGAELVPLVLILASLAGSLALIVMVHRRATSKKPSKAVVAVVLPPSLPAPKPAPVPTPVAEPIPDEPEPPPPPTPEDPTPRVLAKLTSAEAEQLLEASKADRKAASLDQARKSALLESEKWRRRESLVRLQLDSLDTKARKLESQVDELALERDALEKERDARKALASQARSRPGQAILPHRGQNGTWRRPIVIECVNGMAILRPQGISFGLLELSSGFGPTTNPFVATVAREAIRIQGNRSPDGQTVIPYIFFLVRPDGIRAYYEARGRLEPLSITFGYELADQEWEVDFPDLDDVKTWDGSPSDLADVLAKVPVSPPGASPAEEEDFPLLGTGRTSRSRSGSRDEGPGGEFTWPPRTRALQGGGGSGRVGPETSRRPSAPAPGLRFSNSSSSRGAEAPGGVDDESVPQSPPTLALDGPPGGQAGRPRGMAGSSGIEPGSTGSGGDPQNSEAPRELSLGGGPIKPLEPSGPGPGPDPTGRPSPARASVVGPRRVEQGSESASDAPGLGETSPSKPKPSPDDDPANTFIWPAKPNGGKPTSRAGQPTPGGTEPPDLSPPVRHVGPFSKPLAMGLDSLETPGSPPSNSVEGDPTQPDGPVGSPDANPGRRGGGTSTPRGTAGAPSTARGIGQGSPGTTPPPGSIGVGMPGTPPGGTPPSGTPPQGMMPPPASPSSNSAPALPELPTPSIIDRRFEIVLVCGSKGVIVQPGAYRVTANALKDRDGLLKKQIVALVKARRTADPKVTIEPRVRFLVQPGGDKTYWAARSQFLLSGLDWPVSTQVADPDHLAILPSESW